MKNKLWIIVKEVYRKNVLSWSFFFMVMGPILMGLVIGGIGYLIAQDKMSSSVGEIGLVNANPEIQEIVKTTAPDNKYRTDLDEASAKASLLNNEIEGYLVVKESQGKLTPTYYRKPTSKDIALGSIKQGLTQYQMIEMSKKMGLSEEEVAALSNNEVAINTIKLAETNTGDLKEENADDPINFVKTGVAYVVCFLVFMFIMNYMGIISQEIAAEKGSRIMEIILSSVSATTHFFGKMIGIGCVILTQILCYIILYFIGKTVIDQWDLLNQFGDIDIAQYLGQSSDIIGLGLVYALLGILIYTSLAAFLGSLVSKTEDVQKVLTPITLLGVAGFYIGMYALNSTNNPVVQIGSQVPFFTPFVMPFRIAAGTVNQTEIWFSIGLGIIFMIIALVVSSMFYKSNVLVYSEKGIIATLKRSFHLWKSERESRQS